MHIRCRNCSAPISEVGFELPADQAKTAEWPERDFVSVRMHCSNCNASYSVAIDVDEFEIETSPQLPKVA